MDHRAVDPLIRLRILGPVEALSFSGENVLPRGRKAQAILCYLALSPEEFVSRQRLIGLLWSSRWREQGRASLRQSLLELRQALGPGHPTLLRVSRDRVSLARERVWIDGVTARADAPQATPVRAAQLDRLLETLVGLDPCFDDWIAQCREALRHDAASRAGETPELDRPSAAAGPPLAPEGDARTTGRDGVLLSVIPILPVGSMDIEDFLAPALTQELVTALARLRWLSVRFSTEPSGADYVLEGYMSRLSDGLRLVLRLIDRRDRGIIQWTGTMELAWPLQPGSLGEAVEHVVEQLDPEILAIETRKILRRPPASHDSYECLLRAIPLLYRFEEDAWRQATGLLASACDADPQHGRAFAFSALCRVTGLAQGWSGDSGADTAKADRDAAHAIACDPRDSLALAISGHIQSFVHHDFRSALTLFERAIRANPSCGVSWGYSSLTFAYLGRTDEATQRLARAQAIMIHDPYVSFIDSFWAVIAFFAHDWPRAIAVARRHLQLRPSFVAMRKLLIGSLCHCGQIDEALAEDHRLREQEADFSWSMHLDLYPFGRSEDRAATTLALRQARLIDEPLPRTTITAGSVPASLSMAPRARSATVNSVQIP